MTVTQVLRRSGPSLFDALIAAAFVTLTAAEAAFLETARPPLVHAAIAVPVMASLAWRRRFPLLVALAVVLGNLATNPESLYSPVLALVVVAYSVGAEAPPPRHVVGLAVLLAAFSVPALVERSVEPADVAAAIVFIVAPWAVGVGLRQRWEAAQKAIERAARLERSRELETATAVADERARIARELHDIVSHSISVIAVQTQAVRRRLGPEHEREARDLAAVETTARQALAEMRRLFGVLRSDDERLSLAPQPTLEELSRLLDQVREAGLHVELRVGGEPVALPPGVDLAAYRIVQEGLTNVLRHAGVDRAAVALAYGERELEVIVEDSGRGEGGTAGAGNGLVGIRERVALYGGSVEAGERAEGGYRVRARLPIREPR